MSRNGSGDGVLVLDSNGQAATSVVRSLGRRDVPVTAGGSSRWSLGMLSRYSDGTYVHPDPKEDRTAFVGDLVAHLERNDYSVVVPTADHTTLILARHKQAIERTGTVVGTEDWEPFRRAYDKALLHERLASLDVPIPETFVPESVDDVAAIADELDYPVVIKPRSKSHLVDDTVAVTLVSDENYVHSPGELAAAYRRFVRRYERFERRFPLVQEYVPGTTTTTVVLADEGDVLEYFQEERLRTYPSSGGNSALLAAVDDPRMLDHAEAVIDHLDWTGPAMVEFMRTPDDEFYVIEVNGRYWGSLPFAIECGVDFPWHHYRQLRGDGPSRLSGNRSNARGEYRTDVVQRRLLYEDVKWLVENVSSGNVGAVLPFLRSFHRSRHTFVSVDDPAPTLGALAQTAWLGWAALRSRATALTRRVG